MKKFIAALTALCMSAACYAGCSGKNEKAQTEESSRHEVMIPLEMPDINISIPDSYEETSTESNDTVYIKNDASVIVNSDVFTERYNTVEEYMDYAVESYRTYSDEFEILAKEKKKIADTDGELLEFIYRLNTDNGVFSKYCMVAYFSDGEKMYLVTCKADENTFNDYREEFLSIISSVSFE